MKSVRNLVSLVLAVLIALLVAMPVFAAGTVNVQGKYETADGKLEVQEIISVTNVTKKLDESAYSSDEAVFTRLEVSKTTTLTSLKDRVTFRVFNLDDEGSSEFYQDDAHYVKGETNSGYYKKGSYIKLTKPGDYLVVLGASFGPALGEAAFIRVVAGDNQAKSAVPATSKVKVNSDMVEFEAYNIDGNNYLKLRDLAKVVSGTEKQFDVAWDSNLKEIKLVPNTKYSDVGGELKTGDGKAKSAMLCTAPLYKDDARVELTAYTINNNNYFKLRDIAKLFDIGVTWDAGTKTVGINTAESYAE